MTKETIIKAFKRLSELLAKQDTQAEIYIVGGAAMILAYGARTFTKDIDAIYSNKETVYKFFKEIAEEMDLDEHWINDAAKSFIPLKKDENSIAIIDEQNLKVMAASEEYMLAMKLLAARVEDKPDIEFLLNKLNVKSAVDALYIVRYLYPDKLIQPKMQYILEEIFSQKIENNQKHNITKEDDAFTKDLNNRLNKSKGIKR
ncbi:MAG: nucleotidyltransferase [bacterium]